MTTQSRSGQPKFTTKSATVHQMLARPKGASVAEMMAMTGWQNHGVRAFLTGLREKGEKLVPGRGSVRRDSPPHREAACCRTGERRCRRSVK
jgi:hypothetical protein